jgi:hypothetical protein
MLTPRSKSPPKQLINQEMVRQIQSLNLPNFPADFDFAIRRFDPSRPSQPVLRFANIYNLRLAGPEIRAF